MLTIKRSQDQPAHIQSRGRKRKQSIEDALEPSPDPAQKRQRTSLTLSENRFGESVTNTGPPKRKDAISFWAKEGRWPEEPCWLEAASETDPTMERLLSRKKSSSTLSRKRSDSSTSTTLSDQKPREEKSGPYRDQRYETPLGTQGSFMVKSNLDIAGESKTLRRNLLEKQQVVSGGSLFRGDIFESTCQKIHNENKAPQPTSSVVSRHKNLRRQGLFLDLDTRTRKDFIFQSGKEVSAILPSIKVNSLPRGDNIISC